MKRAIGVVAMGLAMVLGCATKPRTVENEPLAVTVSMPVSVGVKTGLPAFKNSSETRPSQPETLVLTLNDDEMKAQTKARLRADAEALFEDLLVEEKLLVLEAIHPGNDTLRYASLWDSFQNDCERLSRLPGHTSEQMLKLAESDPKAPTERALLALAEERRRQREEEMQKDELKAQQAQAEALQVMAGIASKPLFPIVP